MLCVWVFVIVLCNFSVPLFLSLPSSYQSSLCQCIFGVSDEMEKGIRNVLDGSEPGGREVEFPVAAEQYFANPVVGMLGKDSMLFETNNSSIHLSIYCSAMVKCGWRMKVYLIFSRLQTNLINISLEEISKTVTEQEVSQCGSYREGTPLQGP